MKQTRCVVAVFAIVSLVAATAAAESSSQSKAAAARLFDDAKKDITSGKNADACPKFAESQRLDPQLGTLLHLADCYASIGKTASAWASFQEAAEIAAQRGDARESRIRKRVSALEPQLSNLVIDVTGAPPSDLEVRQDGDVVGRGAWGTSIPVDPGKHTVTASASGRKSWSAEIEIGSAAETRHVAIPTLDSVETVGTPPPAMPGPAPSTPATSPSSADVGQAPQASSSRGSTQRLLGWGAVGAGAVGLGIGIAFELQRSAKLSDRDNVCPTRQNCTPGEAAQISSLTSDARTASAIAVTGFVAGGVLAAGGLALIFTAPKGAPSHDVAVVPVAAPGYEGVTVAGRLW
jgi:hypothetical protein